MDIGHGGRGHLIIKPKAPIGYNLGGVNRKIYVLTVDTNVCRFRQNFAFMKENKHKCSERWDF